MWENLSKAGNLEEKFFAFNTNKRKAIQTDMK